MACEANCPVADPIRGDEPLGKSVGFALEDLSALRYVHALSQKLGVGSTVQLVPEMADPKDLFACATAARPVLRKAA